MMFSHHIPLVEFSIEHDVEIKGRHMTYDATCTSHIGVQDWWTHVTLAPAIKHGLDCDSGHFSDIYSNFATPNVTLPLQVTRRVVSI